MPSPSRPRPHWKVRAFTSAEHGARTERHTPAELHSGLCHVPVAEGGEQLPAQRSGGVTGMAVGAISASPSTGRVSCPPQSPHTAYRYALFNSHGILKIKRFHKKMGISRFSLKTMRKSNLNLWLAPPGTTHRLCPARLLGAVLGVRVEMSSLPSWSSCPSGRDGRRATKLHPAVCGLGERRRNRTSFCYSERFTVNTSPVCLHA